MDTGVVHRIGQSSLFFIYLFAREVKILLLSS